MRVAPHDWRLPLKLCPIHRILDHPAICRLSFSCVRCLRVVVLRNSRWCLMPTFRLDHVCAGDWRDGHVG